MKRMTLISTDEASVRHVAVNMRPCDRDEILATHWFDDKETYAAYIHTICRDFGWVACWDEEPAAVVGAYPVWPGVWNVFAFGTDKWPRVATGLTKFIRRGIIPGLQDTGAHRAQCLSLETRTDAHDWLRLLGAKDEALLRGYGKDGEDFVMFRWLCDKKGCLV